MGLKRHFEFEDFQEHHHKHPKPVESDTNEAAQCHGISSEHDVSDGDNCTHPKYPPRQEFDKDIIFDIPYFDIDDFGMSGASSSGTQEFDKDIIFDIPYLDIDDFGMSGASSSVTHGSGEEDVVGHLEDVSSSLDGSPERIVQIGPDYQAKIPPWVGKMDNSDLKYEKNEDNEDKYLGTCIIPMPDESNSGIASEIVGMGRTDCCCVDKGSKRCVRRHISESREDLRNNLDDEQFILLGLADSGEEVAFEWSEEEEQLFNAVVFSNSASLGKNFWRCLSAAFPSRTKAELVSYYFNVFMLRKRATQNRCKFLDIDSDDDEWHENMPEEAQQLSHAYLGCEDQLAVAEKGKIYAERDEDGDGDVDNGEDGMRHNAQETITVKSSAESKLFRNGEETTNVIGDFFGLQDDSCTSFDYSLNPPTETRGRINGECPYNTGTKIVQEERIDRSHQGLR